MLLSRGQVVALRISSLFEHHRLAVGWSVAVIATLCSGIATVAMVELPRRSLVARIPDDDSEVGVTNFLVVGPFLLSTSQLPTDDAGARFRDRDQRLAGGLAIDYLDQQFGVKESGVTMESIRDIRRAVAPIRRGRTEVNFIQTTFGPMHEPLCLDLQAAFRAAAVVTPQNLRGGAIREQPTDYATAYAMTVVESPRDTSLIARLGFDNGVSLWINGRRVFESDTLTPVASDEHLKMIPISVHKGKNVVVAKVYNVQGGRFFTLRFSGIRHARRLMKAEADGHVFSKVLWRTGEPMTLTAEAAWLYPAESEPRLLLARPSGELPVDSSMMRLSSHGWLCKPGVYKATIHSRVGDASELIYCGEDPTMYVAELQIRLARMGAIDDKTEINCNALVHRLRHLLSQANRRDGDRTWQQKVLRLIVESADVWSRLESHNEAFQNVSGLHLRGFRSRIDGQVQHYMVYAPNSRSPKMKPRGLVVRVPYGTIPTRPFLESLHVADTYMIELFETLADRHNVVVVWPNGRSAENETSIRVPVGVTDVFEAIDAVKRDYEIDDARIYLTGECAGGREALGLAVRFPSRFAAIGLTSPFYDRRSTRGVPEDREWRPLHNQIASWNEANSAINLVSNLRNLPIMIVHERGHKHSPIQASYAFVKRAATIGKSVALEVVDYESGTPCPHRSPVARCFAFFDGKVRQDVPRAVSLRVSETKYGSAYWFRVLAKARVSENASIEATVSGEGRVDVRLDNVWRAELVTPAYFGWGKGTYQVYVNNVSVARGCRPGETVGIQMLAKSFEAGSVLKTPDREGPIADVFGDKFLIVTGTGGSGPDRRHAAILSHSIAGRWEKEFFARCRLMRDVEVSETDLATSNLFVVGRISSRSNLHRLALGSPGKSLLDLAKLQSVVGGSSAVGVMFVCPNPAKRRGYMLFLDGYPLHRLSVPIKRPWVDGVYDYIVWSSQSKRVKIQDVGYFDYAWRPATNSAR